MRRKARRFSCSPRRAEPKTRRPKTNRASCRTREALQEHPQQALPPLAVDLVLLREADPVGVVGLVDDAHGVQGRGHHPAVGGAQVAVELHRHLLQLGRGEPQAELPQVVGDILRELLLVDLQPPDQLHGHFVALVGGEAGGDGEKGVPRCVADCHPVADLDEVGQVGGDVEQLRPAGGGEGRQQADVHLLDDPGGAAFEVVQEDLPCTTAMANL